MNFAKWMDGLDEACTTEFDMSIHDLPDISFQIAYQSGYTPGQFREEHLASNRDVRATQASMR